MFDKFVNQMCKLYQLTPCTFMDCNLNLFISDVIKVNISKVKQQLYHNDIYLNIQLAGDVTVLTICSYISDYISQHRIHHICIKNIDNKVLTQLTTLKLSNIDYFSAKSKLHLEHLQVKENICKRNCNTVKLFIHCT